MLKTVVAVTLLLIASTLPAAAAADDACRPVPAARVALSFLPDGHPTVPVVVSGKPLTFAVDTGATNSFLTQEAADALGLASEPFRNGPGVELFGGARLQRYVESPDLSVGGLRATGVPLVVVPVRTLNLAIDGILGSNVVRSYDADFDFPGGKLTLLQPGDCPEAATSGRGAVPFTLDPFAKIDLTVQIDGKDVDAVLDTGATHIVLEMETAESLFGFEGDDPRLKLVHRTAAGLSYYSFPFKTLALGGVTITDPPVYLVPRADSRDTNKRMLLGMSVLRRFHPLIDYRRHKLYFAPPG